MACCRGGRPEAVHLLPCHPEVRRAEGSLASPMGLAPALPVGRETPQSLRSFGMTGNHEGHRLREKGMTDAQ